MFQLAAPSSLKLLAPDCRNCGKHQACAHPKQVNKAASADKVIVINQPYADSAYGLHPSDKALDQALWRVGMSTKDFALTPAAACYNKKTHDDAVFRYCAPKLQNELQRLNPYAVMTWGKHALSSTISTLWGQPAGLPDRWYGLLIPDRTLNAWIMPLGLMGGDARRNQKVSDIWMYRHLKRFKTLTKRPYEQVPDYSKMITKVPTAAQFAVYIDMVLSQGVCTAFDYETTGLKPEEAGHKIATFSVAWIDAHGNTMCGVTPIGDDEIKKSALVKYLQSSIPKIGANSKYERRWSKVILGTDVNNIIWDTMVAAHIQNPMETTTSVKYNAYARLGMPYYANEVEAYFHTSNSNQKNRIFECPLDILMKYNAIDSLVELDLGIMQMREEGIDRGIPWSRNLPDADVLTGYTL